MGNNRRSGRPRRPNEMVERSLPLKLLNIDGVKPPPEGFGFRNRLGHTRSAHFGPIN